MTAPVELCPLDAGGVATAQDAVTRHHYLKKAVDRRCMPEGYSVHLPKLVAGPLGYLLLGRPQATCCYPWYGDVEDVEIGRAEVTRWQVLNLARVWLSPAVQPGGVYFRADWLPGFVDRRGTFRSTLASAVLASLAGVVVRDYLVRRPPVFLEEPYELRWLLSYCDTRRHRGTIYRAAGWQLFRTNPDGVQTWRRPVRPLTEAEDAEVKQAAAVHPRSRAIRGRRSQMTLTLETV